MAEGTHSSEGGLFKLVRGGRGKCLYAGKVTLANSGDTLDTGLDKIDAAVMHPVGSALAGGDGADAHTVSGGTITITSTASGTALLVFEVIAVGTVL